MLSVAHVFNLLYCRIPFGRPFRTGKADEPMSDQRIANP